MIVGGKSDTPRRKLRSSTPLRMRNGEDPRTPKRISWRASMAAHSRKIAEKGAFWRAPSSSSTEENDATGDPPRQRGPTKDGGRGKWKLCLNISDNEQYYHSMIILSYTPYAPCQAKELFVLNLVENFVLSGMFSNTMVPGPTTALEPINTPGMMPA